MYDAVFVLVEAFNRILRKKPDQFRANHLQRRSHTGNSGGGGGNTLNESSALLDCNTPKGWVTPWEQGEKISRVLRKVSNKISNFNKANQKMLMKLQSVPGQRCRNSQFFNEIFIIAFPVTSI